MKTPLRKLFRQLLAKTIIALAGLLVVAPQISYKFFLYANLPSYKTPHREAHAGQFAGVGSSRLTHDRHNHLRVDKRYTGKHVFALPSLPFSVAGQRLNTANPSLPVFHTVSDPLLSDRHLRGPPVASSISLL
jgi:hypothetical protein